MPRLASRALQIVLDVLVLGTVFMLAFLIRFDWNVPPTIFRRAVFLLPYVVALKYVVMHVLDVPRFAWRYIGLRETRKILWALFVSSSFLLAARLVLPPLSNRSPLLDNLWVPLGIIAIDFVLSFCGIVGIRALRRMTAERKQRASTNEAALPTLLVGAGQAGMIVAREIENHPNLAIRAVGFLDDDPIKRGSMLHGIAVLGPADEMKTHAEATGAKQVLITIAGATGAQIRRLVRLSEQAGLPAKIVPGLHEIVGGQVSLSRARNVAIEDLLRRDPVTLDSDAIGGSIEGRSLLVTGAGGSIGSELCRQVAKFQPSKLVLVEQAENALFQVHRELTASFPDLCIVPAIADITDKVRMERLFEAHRPFIVLHAAAHKHVPMMEWNPGEATKNNVFGTKVCADLADRFGVERFVLISTDKAVRPTSVMGATKRVAELYVQALADSSSTKFVAVRFGNVLGSAGSVIPIFKEQIAAGGPVTVTHPDMERYFMTIPEASQLVLQAGVMGKGSEIFILDMGEPVKIVDLAEDLIRLSGLRPGDDIEIQFTGIRPGEKLVEELSAAQESADKTFHSKIFVGRIAPTPLAHLLPLLGALDAELDRADCDRIKRLLQRLVPEFQLTDDQAEASSERASAAGTVSPAVSAVGQQV